eukprot:1697533-Rhodomonas_salina.1
MRARTIAAPTHDQDVKHQLRNFQEPVCLFGEGPAERRDRLKTILARLEVEQGISANEVVAATVKQHLAAPREDGDDKKVAPAPYRGCDGCLCGCEWMCHDAQCDGPSDVRRRLCSSTVHCPLSTVQCAVSARACVTRAFGEQEVFYTEGSEDLKQARLFLLQYSLP